MSSLYQTNEVRCRFSYLTVKSSEVRILVWVAGCCFFHSGLLHNTNKSVSLRFKRDKLKLHTGLFWTKETKPFLTEKAVCCRPPSGNSGKLPRSEILGTSASWGIMGSHRPQHGRWLDCVQEVIQQDIRGSERRSYQVNASFSFF